MILKPGTIGGILFFVVAATLPLWLLRGPYLQGIGVTALIVASLAVAWNIVGGLGGRLSFGHAAFFGVGGYTSSLLLINFNISPWIGGLAGMLVAGILALLLGSITVHLRGIYFTLVTFVFALILLNLARTVSSITGGDVGLSLPLIQPSFGMLQFRDQINYYYVALGLLLVYVIIAAFIIKSPFGYRLKSVRDDEQVARALGVHTNQVKIQAFVLSAMMVSFAGTLMAQHGLFIDPGSAFGVDRSVEMALGAIFGGIGTLWGPVVGGIAVVAIGEAANNALQDVFAGADTLVYGIVLVAVALWLPGGVASISGLFRKKTGKRRKPTSQEDETESMNKPEAVITR
ncbi:MULTISPECIES: branched-chain amino acid ABC transporter permease [unclassified Cryobacterium]|uniref:branched-chain amino acid ABC transporter permease n=1 Tax=unclassified Cryobacterium TaxID=2649013 RepID=UPI00106900A0|nr:MULTISPECIES: branched-chain amino acid ABC transporter permease [unclassified Cryobacterium]TFD02972.1 branched-chain amino acid ABC transporter permease [Cryobacterium sp. TMT1-66-1]TFD15343.1 branched-chain amino acid ABC transporter permease [Cryobacterium sp. TMT1-2-2]